MCRVEAGGGWQPNARSSRKAKLWEVAGGAAQFLSRADLMELVGREAGAHVVVLRVWVVDAVLAALQLAAIVASKLLDDLWGGGRKVS